MPYGMFKDRAREWLTTNKLLLIQLGAAVAIAVIVGAIMIPSIAVTKRGQVATVNRLEQGISHVGSEVADLAQKHGDLEDDVEAIDTELGSITGTASEQANQLTAVKTRVTILEGTNGQIALNTEGITELETHLAAISANITTMGEDIAALNATLTSMGAEIETLNATATDNSTAIAVLEAQVAVLEQECEDITAGIVAINAALDTIGEDITALEAAVADITSPPQAYLSGSFGDYTLHAEACQAGEYAAVIHLCYGSPVELAGGNYTAAIADFYASIDWGDPDVRDYVPALSYDGAGWGVTGISFNIGTFTLEARTEKAVAVEFGGLDSDYEPDWAYAEIWPALKES